MYVYIYIYICTERRGSDPWWSKSKQRGLWICRKIRTCGAKSLENESFQKKKTMIFIKNAFRSMTSANFDDFSCFFAEIRRGGRAKCVFYKNHSFFFFFWKLSFSRDLAHAMNSFGGLRVLEVRDPVVRGLRSSLPPSQPPTCLRACLPVCLSLSLCLSECLSACLPVCLYACLADKQNRGSQTSIQPVSQPITQSIGFGLGF